MRSSKPSPENPPSPLDDGPDDLSDRGPVAPDIERAWIARAEEATVKRLRDEARALGRTRSVRASGQAAPLDDAAWHASLRREPGTARDRVQRFGTEAAERPSPDVFIHLRLPHDLARDFLGVVESCRARLSDLADSVPWDDPWPDAHAAPSVIAARTLSVRSRRVPACVGLLALLEDFLWRLGKKDLAVWYRNERRVVASARGSARNA